MILLSVFLLFFHTLCFGENTPTVVVSVAPYKFFVEAIADKTVNIELLVPPGASFHHYEPTTQQVLKVAKADVWFRVGESFEAKAMNALKSHNPKIKIIDLREGVDLITVDEGHHACCHAGGEDLHIWLSPKEAEKQVHHIADALSAAYPENKELYKKNSQQLITQLHQLDREIADQLAPLKNRKIMVSHPAYAYFARDYNLEQIPIEFEGKDPSPRQLDEIMKTARRENIKTIFAQSQYGVKGAQLIARQLNAKVVMLNPYSGDYFNSLHEIADRIANQDTP